MQQNLTDDYENLDAKFNACMGGFDYRAVLAELDEFYVHLILVGNACDDLTDQKIFIELELKVADLKERLAAKLEKPVLITAN